MKQYHLVIRNGLFFTRAALKHQNLVRVVNLLMDTGASYTILSWATLISLGLDPASSTVRRPVTTASGLVWMPLVELEEFHAFGQSIAQFPVLAHTVPLGSQVSGILGMDFLREFKIKLDFQQAIVEIRDKQ
ncbi:MAG: retropepsin-like domain-containing protein [Blastocatellia bacterium]|nr:retropepsin-like domain-containing protein [Blastocatellia bacterium]